MDRSIKNNIAHIMDAIREKAKVCGRDAAGIKLMAATKTVEDARILEAIEAGISIVGENYVQEAEKKKARMEQQANRVEWHMIGRLQTNKVRYAVKIFDMIHSLDRMELALEIHKRAKAISRVVRVLIEVNTGGEKTKSGMSPSGVIELIRSVANLENISIEGLMTMPPWFSDPEKARPYFKCLRELKEKIEALNIPNVNMKELSMGMTVDYLTAIEEGATIVRIGRGIFGERT
jgi:PLP dependent protein